MLQSFDNLVEISAGYAHTMILNDKGKLFLFGKNDVTFQRNLNFLQYGQLGDGTLNSRNSPFAPILENDNVIKIATGQYHSVFLKNDGRVFAIGRNDVHSIFLINKFGQLGDGTYDHRFYAKEIIKERQIVDISASDVHTIILNSKGKAFSFGYGNVISFFLNFLLGRTTLFWKLQF
jgi:alpha-tubulin suppressor-like RCC1 family protein